MGNALSVKSGSAGLTSRSGSGAVAATVCCAVLDGVGAGVDWAVATDGRRNVIATTNDERTTDIPCASRRLASSIIPCAVKVT